MLVLRPAVQTRQVSTRRAVRLGVACAASVPLALALAGPALAAPPVASAGAGTATVGVASDAWYAASSACTATPTGCLPAALPASAYPAKTLQVGVAGGQEESRAYLALDLTALPAGTRLTGGVLRLPVGSTEDGSRLPDTATLQACLVTGSVNDDAEGSTEQPPTIDCKTASAPAKYLAAAAPAAEMFTVDLAPFVNAWSSGGGAAAIALVPAADTPPDSGWHVALSAHDRTVPAAQHVSATVTFSAAQSSGDVPPPTVDVVAPPPATSLGTGSASFAAPPLAPVSTVQLAPAVTPELPAAAPAVAPQAAPAAPQSQPQAVALVSGFAYPGVFLLPILLLAAAGWMGRALTRDLTAA